MRRLLAVTGVLLAVAFAAAADELVITHGGRRVIDPDPTTAATNCNGWSYDPAPVAFENDISNVYSTTGILRNACTDQFPFGDEIWHARRGSNGVFTMQPAITRTTFRWMFGDQPIDPGSYIGRVASPSVIRSADGRYFMAFVASVSDPSLCAGAHTGQVCGLCLDPFSYYVMYWAMSLDGVTWHLYNPVNPASNIALQNALLYREPNSDDKVPGSPYTGVKRVRILFADGYVWFLTQFASRGGVRTLMLRAPFDQSTQWGITGPVEGWRGDKTQWQTATDGILPDEFDDPDLPVDIYPAIVSIAETTHITSQRFIGLIPSDASINYVTSNDLLSWTPPRTLRSAIPYFADGRGYAGSIVDSTLVEDSANTMHLFMASDDGDSDHGIARDGLSDCPSSPYPAGLGIYEGIVELAPIVNTAISVTSHKLPSPSNVVEFDVSVSAADGSLPNGRINLSSIGFNSTVDVNSGHAVVFALLNTPGTYPVHATFTSLGPWAMSNADTQITVAQTSPSKRRAVRH